MSVLFTGSTGVKFVNVINKLPLKLLLSYNSTHSNDIESVTQQWRKSAPTILSTTIASLMAPVHVPTLEKPSPGTNSPIY